MASVAQFTVAVVFALLTSGSHAAAAACPYIGSSDDRQFIVSDDALPSGHPHVLLPLVAQREHRQTIAAKVDYEAVRRDLRELMHDSKEFWPADTYPDGSGGNYGPLFVRLAWHSAGTYRLWDGRGGLDGARQRFDPERSWPDNTNLDKARKLLVPLKVKYPGLSWGDLIALSGTVAIEDMGGPVLGFCAGRIDDADGTASLELGPSAEQMRVAPCQGTDRYNWNCSSPLGPTQVGWIYVNPEGPAGQPDPAGSVGQVRDSFGRMGHNDSETVALIGGGHAFGKVHGACPSGPGPAPDEDPTNPWPGTCGTGAMKGKGPNTFTAGFEGSWTHTPAKWTNDYFHNLLDFNWTKHIGPGGHYQWAPNQKEGGRKPGQIMMLTSDISLIHDPIYLELVKDFQDMSKINTAFAHAWYKLMTADMGPRTRCLNSDAPPAQPFQMPLPDPPAKLANFEQVKDEIRRFLRTPHSALPGDEDQDGRPYYGALFATLAWQCASTFRSTDYKGGCNGARIRFSPEKDFNGNQGLDKVLDVLSEIKSNFSDSNGALSWADLIVLAGTTAVENAANIQLRFCGGRTDASKGDGTPEYLAPRQYHTPLIEAVDSAKVMGLNAWEFVALQGGLRSPVHQRAVGYSGSWNNGRVAELSNRYFTVLLEHDWVLHNKTVSEYQARGDSSLYMTPRDLAIVYHAEYAAAAQEFAADNELFKQVYAAAWTKMMNADRFKGPAGSVCPK